MAPQSIKCSLHSCNCVVIALIMLSMFVEADNMMKQRLNMLFEEALMNSSESLYVLQNLYFNPKQSPEQVCISVTVTVENIVDLDPDHYRCSEYRGPAFNCPDDISTPTRYCGQLQFTSVYELQLQTVSDESSTSQLTKLLTKSGSTGVFYAFDPSFYTLMKALSSSLELTFPGSSFDDYDDDDLDRTANIEIHIATELKVMPCWDDADSALEILLVWVRSIQIIIKCIDYSIYYKE